MRFGLYSLINLFLVSLSFSPSPCGFGCLKLPHQLLWSRWISSDFMEHVDNGVFTWGIFRFV